MEKTVLPSEEVKIISFRKKFPFFIFEVIKFVKMTYCIITRSHQEKKCSANKSMRDYLQNDSIEARIT